MIHSLKRLLKDNEPARSLVFEQTMMSFVLQYFERCWCLRVPRLLVLPKYQYFQSYKCLYAPFSTIDVNLLLFIHLHKNKE